MLDLQWQRERESETEREREREGEEINSLRKTSTWKSFEFFFRFCHFFAMKYFPE